MWTKNDGIHLYVALQFTSDSNNPWVAIQFDVSSHMSSGADGAIFGHDSIGANEYRDISFGSVCIFSVDTTQNGVGAICVGDSNQVTIESKKPLDSGDSFLVSVFWDLSNLLKRHKALYHFRKFEGRNYVTILQRFQG